MAGSNSGMIFGLVMGGFFADTIGWRAGFAVLAVALATTSIALWVRARRVASAAAVASGLDAVRANATTASAPATNTSRCSHCHQQQEKIARQFATVLRNGRARLVLAIVVAEGALALQQALAFHPDLPASSTRHAAVDVRTGGRGLRCRRDQLCAERTLGWCRAWANAG